MNDTEKQHQIDVLTKYFDAARANIITRLAARDNCILLCLAAVAAILTASYTDTKDGYPRYDVLLVIPIVSLVVSVFVSQHNFMMDTLYEYIAKEIEMPLKQFGITVTPWEISDNYRSTRLYSHILRLVGETTVILFPAFFALYTHSHAKEDQKNDF